MVSEQSRVVVERWIAAFNQRDIDVLLEATTSDFEFVPYTARLLEATTYRGREGLREYFREVDLTWDGIEIRLDEVHSAPDDRVFVKGGLHARGLASGVEVKVALAWVAGFRDGKLAWAHTYESEAEALAAAGLAD